MSWSAKARFRLREIHDYIAQDSPAQARQMVDLLTARSSRLALTPRADRSVPEYRQEHLREILERPYRIIYLVGVGRIDIVTVKHYRQRLPRSPTKL